MKFEDWFYQDGTENPKLVMDFEKQWVLLEASMERFLRKAYKAGYSMEGFLRKAYEAGYEQGVKDKE